MRYRLRITILCEDREQERFLRALCERLGLYVERIERPPPGTGSAEQWVRVHYPPEVRIHRAKANHVSIGLIVAIDGNSKGLTYRKKQLEEALTAAELELRGAQERVAVVVPTWSIETWLAWLCGFRDIDEKQPYKEATWFRKAVADRSITPKKAAERWISARSESPLPSLADGYIEMDRFSRS